MKRERISIVVPCYNEEETLPIFYKELSRISKKMKKLDFEFLFINDGSNDNTLSILRELSKVDKRVRYLSFSRNFGKEAGIYAGFSSAVGDYVGVMDADMQDPPELLIDMYDSIVNEGYDCVALYTNCHSDYGLFRSFFTKCWYRIIGVISSVKQVPGARDFRLMRRRMVDAIVNMGEYNRYSKGIFGFVGFETKWINYDAPHRVAGKSKFNFIKLFKYAIEGIVAFSTVPLVLSAFIGILFCLISFFVIVFIIIKTLIYGDPVSGWPSLACIVMFMGGIQLFFLGIMGMYLSKTYLEVKKRPIYILKETEKDL